MSFLTTVVLITLISFDGYSSVKSDGEEKSVRVLKFHTEIDNKNSLVEVELTNNQIDKLKIDGKEISSDDFSNYKEMVNSRLKNISDESINLDGEDVKIIKIVDDSGDGDSVEKVIIITDNDFNEKATSRIAHRMKILQDHLSDSADSLKKKKFKVIVRDGNSDLTGLDSNIFNFEFDLDKLHDQLSKLPELMKDFDFDVPAFSDRGIKDINKRLERLERKLEKSEKELEKTKKELDKTKDFIKKFKSELVKDKLINSANDEPEIEFFSDEMIVNGKSVSKQQFEKYKKMYEDTIGKEERRELYFKMK
jgi:predicted  nucleic acid-binding Zn-ribbon protein